jgi:hypothetical protein
VFFSAQQRLPVSMPTDAGGEKRVPTRGGFCSAVSRYLGPIR